MQKFKQRRKGKSPTLTTQKTTISLLAYIFLNVFLCVYEYLPMDVEFYGYLLAIYVDIFFANKYTSVW